MKILLVVGVLLVLALVLYRVLRPVITIARQFLKTIRHFQQVASPPARPGNAAEKLVKCETCGVWTPEGRTLSSGSLAYCSRECLKRAGTSRRTNTAA
ncbi:MAG TPA: PP0621 family protein [Pyrinomonadaceae bacterium]|nr:PP0621 family protein [Pyrinomonadaceae bacterium]